MKDGEATFTQRTQGGVLIWLVKDMTPPFHDALALLETGDGQVNIEPHKFSLDVLVCWQKVLQHTTQPAMKWMRIWISARIPKHLVIWQKKPLNVIFTSSTGWLPVSGLLEEGPEQTGLSELDWPRGASSGGTLQWWRRLSWHLLGMAPTTDTKHQRPLF